MPTYEFVCNECGYTFEKFLNMNEDKNLKCPVCEGRTRLIISSGAQVIFKGSGFHSTDYRDSDTRTCCGRDEKCKEPPCSTSGVCRRGE